MKVARWGQRQEPAIQRQGENTWPQVGKGLDAMGPFSAGDLGSASWTCLGEMAGPCGEVAGWRTLEVKPKAQ